MFYCLLKFFIRIKFYIKKTRNFVFYNLSKAKKKFINHLKRYSFFQNYFLGELEGETGSENATRCFQSEVFICWVLLNIFYLTKLFLISTIKFDLKVLNLSFLLSKLFLACFLKQKSFFSDDLSLVSILFAVKVCAFDERVK